MILVVDNEDSFVHNLARYFACLGREAIAVRHHDLTLEAVQSLAPTAIVLSPGPGSPQDEDFSVQVVRKFWQQLPILGVCLGHQQIGFALGARIIRADQPVHGRTSLIAHDGLAEFEGIESPFAATRYHSLLVDETTLPPTLAVTARTPNGALMGFRAIEYPVIGWQFHPESILTTVGSKLISGFLSVVDVDTTGQRRDGRAADADSKAPDSVPNSTAVSL